MKSILQLFARKTGDTYGDNLTFCRCYKDVVMYKMNLVDFYWHDSASLLQSSIVVKRIAIDHHFSCAIDGQKLKNMNKAENYGFSMAKFADSGPRASYDILDHKI